MMVRLLRSGKWELIILFISSSAVSSLIAYITWRLLQQSDTSTMAARLCTAIVFLLVSAAFGYWAVQRMGRRIDILHLAMKQAINGNYEVRIDESGPNQLLIVYQEFNLLAGQMEKMLKQLQRQGEEQIMLEAASNEAAVLEERKRLARDLHDTVSQQLFAIHMCASSLPKLQQVDAERAASVLDQLVQMSNLAQKQMRNFIAQLRPMELEGKTLKEALDKWFPDYCRQNYLQGELEWRLFDPLTEAKEHQLFLIIQEAMANIVKHAKASSCTLTLADNERQVFMLLQDNGTGFKVNEVKRGSYGLSTMQERAHKLGGSTEIFSKPGSGTRIKVTIPKIWQGEDAS